MNRLEAENWSRAFEYLAKAEEVFQQTIPITLYNRELVRQIGQINEQIRQTSEQIRQIAAGIDKYHS